MQSLANKTATITFHTMCVYECYRYFITIFSRTWKMTSCIPFVLHDCNIHLRLSSLKWIHCSNTLKPSGWVIILCGPATVIAALIIFYYTAYIYSCRHKDNIQGKICIIACEDNILLFDRNKSPKIREILSYHLMFLRRFRIETFYFDGQGNKMTRISLEVVVAHPTQAKWLSWRWRGPLADNDVTTCKEQNTHIHYQWSYCGA